MEIRQVMRRLLPASRARAAPPPDVQTKVVLADYYAALQSAGIYSRYRARPWPVERAVTEAYERLVWVYKSVEAISSHAATLPFQLKQGEEAVKDHPLYKVMNKKANPLETGRQFRKRLSAQILLSKRGAFVEVTRSRGGDIVRLDLLPPGRTMPIPGSGADLVSHYEVLRTDGSRQRIETENVRWFRDPHPLDPYCGVTPLEAAGMSVELDFFTRLYNVSFLKNDARPGGVLAVNGDMGDDEMDRIEDRFGKGAAEAGKLTVIAGEVSYVDLAAQPRDMQHEVTANIAKKEILTAFGVPESVIGDASGRTWDNAEQELHNFWTITMPTHLALISTGLDEDSEDDFEGSFDTEEIEVLQRAKKARREEARIEFEAGLISIDEYRDIAGYEAVDNEHTRALYITSGKTPIPTSEEDAEKFGLGEAEQEIVEQVQQAAQAAAVTAPQDDAAQGALTKPASGEPAALPPKPAQPELTAAAKKRLAAVPPFVAPPVARPVVRLIRPAETKAAPLTADSSPDTGARDTLEASLSAALAALSLRLVARTATRLSSPKARKGTRHWTPEYAVDSRVGTKNLDAEQAVDAQRWQQEAEQTAHPLIEAAAVAAGAALLADFGAAALPMPDTVAPVVAAVVRMIGLSAAAQAARLTATIRAADATGTPMADLKLTTHSYATRMTTWANAVAVQAATATVNGARTTTAQTWVDQAPGRTVNAMWRHRGDALVRPSHQEAGGQSRPLGEAFEVGQSWLRFPGDPDGPPHEVYGCRCWLSHRSTVTGRFVPTPAGAVVRMTRADREALAL